MAYDSGFFGRVGETDLWPGEMGWQGDQITIELTVPENLPSDALYYRFSVNITHHFEQNFDLQILAGTASDVLFFAGVERMTGPRFYSVDIPLCRFVPGQTAYIRIEGAGVQVGGGRPPGIAWDYWTLRAVLPADLDEIRLDQIRRNLNFVIEAIQPSGLVRDALKLQTHVPHTHPASPDAAGFALLALCAGDHLHLLSDAAARVELILSAYAGLRPGVAPPRSAGPGVGGRGRAPGDAALEYGHRPHRVDAQQGRGARLPLFSGAGSGAGTGAAGVD
jgi:hypothetical protein